MKGTPRSLKVLAFITTSGIALAVAVLVVSLSVATGFEDSYKRSILDFNAHLVLLKDGGEIREYEKLVSELSKFDGIVGEMPFIYRESMLVRKGSVKGIVVKGVDLERMKSISNVSIKLFGTVPDEGTQTVILGKDLAARFDIEGPEYVNLLIGENRFEKRLVAGTFESGLYDYDSQFALMPLHEAQKLFGIGDEATGIEMKLSDPDDAVPMATLIADEFGYPYNVTTWQELNKPIFDAVRMEKMMFAMIVGVLVLVGMFNIIGTLVLRIIYKMKDISTLSAIGMRPNLLRVIFTFHGTVLGVVGTFAGLLLGALLAYLIGHLRLIDIEPEIYFLSSLPVKIDLGLMAVIGFFGLLVSWAVSFIASTKVAALNIVEGLKA